MRRGIGVGHIHSKKVQADKMSSLGAQLTAERVGHLSNQLEHLTEQIQAIAAENESEIRNDPVARAKFLHLADALQVDLLTDTTTAALDADKPRSKLSKLELSSFYSHLASKVITVCKSESVYTGALVPLSNVVRGLKRQQQRGGGSSSTHQEISAEDVKVALREVALMCAHAVHNNNTLPPSSSPTSRSPTSSSPSTTDISAAPLYSVVSIGGEDHVKVASIAAGASTSLVDAMELHTLITARLQGGNNSGKDAIGSSIDAASHHHRSAVRSMYAAPGVSSRMGRFTATSGTRQQHYQHPESDSASTSAPASPSLSLEEILHVAPVNWSRIRSLVALQQLLTDGVAWMDVPPRTTTTNTITPPPKVKEDVEYVFVSGGSGSTARTHNKTGSNTPSGPLSVLQTPNATFWFIELV